MTAQQLWQEFCNQTRQNPDTPYEAWAFGGAPDQLAQLVLAGIKTGTASAYDLYALDPSEPMPKVGDYSVILDSREQAVCVIRTEKTTVLPFSQVDAHHAWLEGEGDRSLEYWRKVHEEFFTGEFSQYGLEFHRERRILCEEFSVCYRPGESGQ